MSLSSFDRLVSIAAALVITISLVAASAAPLPSAASRSAPVAMLA